MASRRKRKNKRKSASQLTRARWSQNDNTRAQTFADRTKVHDKQAARGRTVRANNKEDLTD